MEISVVLDLQDQEGVSQRKKPFQVNTQTTIKELSKTIDSVFNIKEKYQDIFHNGRQILSTTSTLQQLDVKNDDEIVIKHTSLPQWHNYLTIVQKFREDNKYRSKQEKAVEARELAKQLYDSEFFAAYATFYSDLLRVREEYAVFLDNTPDFIREATKTFFTRKFSDKFIDVQFEDKVSGSRSGTVCTVRFDDCRQVYYIKTNHNASSISPTHRGPLNLIELFLYKLLEVMNIGAMIYFIPDLVASTKIVYICGKELSTFKTLAMLEKHCEVYERETVKQSEDHARALIQISTLAQILGLSDLNAENLGFLENSCFFKIVDFRTGFIDSSVAFEEINHPKGVLSLVSQLRMNLGRFAALVKNMTYVEQLRIAKEYIDQCDITVKLNEALAKLNEDKEIFRRCDSSFDRGTEALTEYINVVREKITQICNL